MLRKLKNTVRKRFIGLSPKNDKITLVILNLIQDLIFGLHPQNGREVILSEVKEHMNNISVLSIPAQHKIVPHPNPPQAGEGTNSFQHKTSTRIAFTLAEVLITLGIIGIVAAMTIPTLSKKINDHITIAKLQETYSMLSQAIKISEEEYGNATTWTVTYNNSKSASDIAEKILPSLKILQDCGLNDSRQLCTGGEYYNKDGTFHTNYSTDLKVYKVILLNGTTIWWYVATPNNIMFYVDANGPKKPNTWGKDLFAFDYNNGADTALVPMGHPLNRRPYSKHCQQKNSDGYGCAWWALTYKNLDYK